MNIHKHFNRLAARLGISLAATCAPMANAEPIVPPGSNPDYLPRLYERLVNNSNVPDFSRLRVHSSVTELTDVPQDEWLQRLMNMTPDEAEAEVQSCIQSLCEHKYPLLNPSEKFVARLMVIEAMFHNGLNDQEFRVYSEFLSRFQPNRDFLDNDDAMIERIVDRIIASPAYANIRDNLVPASQIDTNNAATQFNIRVNFIKFVSDEIRTAYRRESISTYLDRFPSILNGTAAVTFDRNGNPELETQRAVLYNYNALGERNVEVLLDITAHETRHTIDFDDRQMALNRQLPADDPCFSHTAVINLNQNLYVPLCATRTFGNVSCPQQYEWYRRQYVERSAQDFANKVVLKFREKLRTPAPSRVSGRLETHKLELPA